MDIDHIHQSLKLFLLNHTAPNVLSMFKHTCQRIQFWSVDRGENHLHCQTENSHLHTVLIAGGLFSNMNTAECCSVLSVTYKPLCVYITYKSCSSSSWIIDHTHWFMKHNCYPPPIAPLCCFTVRSCFTLQRKMYRKNSTRLQIRLLICMFFMPLHGRGFCFQVVCLSATMNWLKQEFACKPQH